MKDILTVIIVILLGLWLVGFAHAEIKDGEYNMCLMTLNMDRIVCSSDIGAKFIVSGDQWAMGDYSGRLEDNGDFAKLYLTQECRFSPYKLDGMVNLLKCMKCLVTK